MTDYAFRVLTLAQILEKIHDDDISYYRNILRHFKHQFIITGKGKDEADPDSTARYIVSSGNPFGNIRYMDYSVRYICNVVASNIMPMPVSTAMRKFQGGTYARALNDAVESCLLFRITSDSEEFLVVPAEYRFMRDSIMRLSSHSTLDNALMDSGKTRLKEFLDSVDIRSVPSTDEVFLKAAVYSHVINGFEQMLSILTPTARKVYNNIMDQYGIVSSGEISQLITANDKKGEENRGTSQRSGSRNDAEKGDVIWQLTYNFILLTVKTSSSGIDMAYIIPDEIMFLKSMEERSRVSAVSNMTYQETRDEDYSMAIGLRNFLIASYYLELQGKRRTADKLSSILSVSEESLTFLDRFCRHSNFIFGSNSTYHITQAGIDAMSDLASIERNNKRYISTALAESMYSVESNDRYLLKVEGLVYDLLRSAGAAYRIPDLRTLIKWNPEIINKFRQEFLEDITHHSYWKGSGDIGGDIRKRLLDMADLKRLNSALKHLAGLGVVRIGHEPGENGNEVVFVPAKDRAKSSTDVDAGRLQDYVARNRARPVVQSNFEVIVSPLEDFHTVRSLLYGAELISASTSMAFRITEKSLRFYANNLGDLNEFLSLLAEKSAHAIPENVSRTFRDMAAHSGEVTVRGCSGILVFRNSILLKKMMSNRTFSKINTFPISENVFGITDASDFQKIGKTLGDAGILYRVEEGGSSGKERVSARRYRKKRRYSEGWEDSLD